MSRWYRAYEGTCADPKFGEAAVIAETSRSVVVATWHAILESAASAQDGGRFETNERRIAAMLGEPVAVIAAVLAAFAEIGLIGESVVTKWRLRQFESDNSTERSRRHRERKRAVAEMDDIDAETSMQRCSNTPETETYTETETEEEAAQLRAGARARGGEPVQLSAKPIPETSPDRREQLDALEASLRSAAQLEQSSSPGLMNLSPILGVMEAGADLNLDVLPTLRAKAKAGTKARSWAFFVPAIEEAAQARKATAARVVPSTPKETPPDVWNLWIKGYREKHSWLPALGPEPEQPGCRAPADILATYGFAATSTVPALGVA